CAAITPFACVAVALCSCCAAVAPHIRATVSPLARSACRFAAAVPPSLLLSVAVVAPLTLVLLRSLSLELTRTRWNVVMPVIVAKSISILSDVGLGMAMFSLGLFMILQPKIIACGNTVASFAMAVHFLTGPAVMAVASIVVGLRGVLLHIAIVQAALPQGIVPFVFAKEYNVHPDILSLGVIFGMLIALSITLVYYILLGL
ncbi:hypothetical protein HN51_012299, partial [Arachis hypogaea]